MSKLRDFVKLSSVAFVTAALSLTLVNCTGKSRQTEFGKNLSEGENTALSYEEMVEAIGKEKTDAIYNNMGEEDFNLLQYGLSPSNVVRLLTLI